MTTRSTAGVILRGTASLAGILLILLALPAALVALGGNPLPSTAPSFDAVVGALSRPDDGTLLVGILTILGWLVWATLAVSFLVEIPAAIRGIPAPRLPGLSWQQGQVAAMTGAVAAMIALAGTGSATTASASVDPAVSTTPVSATQSSLNDAASGTITTSTREKTMTVKSGDSLWAIAEAELGDGERYPEIVAASKGTVQPDGQQLEDSTDIRPGWQLTIPDTREGSATTDRSPGGAQARLPSSSSSSSQAGSDTAKDQRVAADREMAHRFARGGSGSPAPVATGAPITSHAPDDAETEPDDSFASTQMAAAGLGSLTCGGVLTLVARRRRRQQQLRRPGWRIALPTGRPAQLEGRLNEESDPSAGQALDIALRDLATRCGPALPSLRAARLSTESIEVYVVEEDLEPPLPWRSAGNGTWVLERSDQPAPDDAGAAPTPWPALVSVGHDEDEAQILLNLEQIGSLGLAGTRDVVSAVLTGIAVDLLTAATKGTRVSLVGAMPDLVEAVDEERFHYASDLDGVLDRLETHGPQGHEVVVSAIPMRPWQAKRWRAMTASVSVGALGLVVPGNAGTDWSLAVDAGEPGPMAVLHPVGMTLHAHHLTNAGYQDLLDLLRTTWAPDVPGTIPVGADQTLTLQTLPRAGGSALTDSAPPEETTSLSQLAGTESPVLRVLGRVEVTGAHGRSPEDATTATELVTLLALHPGSDDAGLAQVMAQEPDDDIEAVLGSARRWLGTNTDGAPRVLSGPEGHRLHDVVLDWDQLRALVGRSLAHTPPRSLRAALSLVTAAPLDDAPAGRYEWARRDRYELSATIADIAHELADRCLRHGDPDAAAWAAQKGWSPSPSARHSGATPSTPHGRPTTPSTSAPSSPTPENTYPRPPPSWTPRPGEQRQHQQEQTNELPQHHRARGRHSRPRRSYHTATRRAS